MSGRTSTIQLAVSAVAVAAIAWPAAASAFPGPLPAKVTARGHTVNAVIGSYCVDSTNGNAGICVDKSYAEPGRRHRLAVAPGVRMTFEFRNSTQLNDDVAGASASLVRFGNDGRPENVGRLEISPKGDAWSATLPKKLHRANAVDVFTSLDGDGDIDYLVGLDTSRRQPLRCPGEVGVPVRAREIRGLTVDSATALAEQRGCQLRIVRIDGVPQAVTEDLSFSRVNVIVRKGLVVGIDGIY